MLSPSTSPTTLLTRAQTQQAQPCFCVAANSAPTRNLPTKGGDVAVAYLNHNGADEVATFDP